jgi:hypothetical protein
MIIFVSLFKYKMYDEKIFFLSEDKLYYNMISCIDLNHHMILLGYTNIT